MSDLNNVIDADAALAAAASLDELLDLLGEIDSEILGHCDLPGLPTFGGVEPRETAGIWSWDETRLLVDDHKRGRGFTIVDRATW